MLYSSSILFNTFWFATCFIGDVFAVLLSYMNAIKKIEVGNNNNISNHMQFTVNIKLDEIMANCRKFAIFKKCFAKLPKNYNVSKCFAPLQHGHW